MVKNVFEVDGDEGVVEFKVISTCPQPICIVSPDTLIFCNGAPLKKEVSNSESSSEFCYIFSSFSSWVKMDFKKSS